MAENKLIDKLTEKVSRGMARKTSRRGYLGWLGAGMVGASLLPLLPVARANEKANRNGKMLKTPK